jgi:hypothetical protein
MLLRTGLQENVVSAEKWGSPRESGCGPEQRACRTTVDRGGGWKIYGVSPCRPLGLHVGVFFA